MGTLPVDFVARRTYRARADIALPGTSGSRAQSDKVCSGAPTSAVLWRLALLLRGPKRLAAALTRRPEALAMALPPPSTAHALNM